MAQCFDDTIPTLPEGPPSTTCAVCSVPVWNTAQMRTAHVAWHALAVTEGAAWGVVASPNMPLSATVDVPVPLSRTMATTDYAATAEIVSGTGSVLAGARVQGITTRTTTSVTVRVQNTGLAALAPSAFSVAVLARGLLGVPPAT